MLPKAALTSYFIYSSQRPQTTLKYQLQLSSTSYVAQAPDNSDQLELSTITYNSQVPVTTLKNQLHFSSTGCHFSSTGWISQVPAGCVAPLRGGAVRA